MRTTREEALRTATNNHDNWEPGAVALGSGRGGERVDRWDVATFEESMARCEDRAYRLAVHLVRSEGAAREILQESFLSAWENTSNFTSRSQFSRWVYRATVQSALGRLKSTSAQEFSADGDLLLSLSTIPRFWNRATRVAESDWSILPARQLSSEDLFHHIRKTVNLLPPDLRTVFVLCDLEEISIEDSAEILDLPVAAAKESLHAARMAIRHSIGLHFSRDASKCQCHAS
jgi:RNA polymerase sigma-70 factor (ECF subfamily)